PNTPAATMPHQVDRAISRRRVKIISDAAAQHRANHMRARIGDTTRVLVEENNIARDPHDIAVRISGDKIAPRTICDVKIVAIDGDMFVGEIL
ncbi:MAG: hypothetical protein K2L94_00490, partial [Alphaproteobacteria bacterium]|nr:hypothetical protein [Alphaproteobacteria bacterium]